MAYSGACQVIGSVANNHRAGFVVIDGGRDSHNACADDHALSQRRHPMALAAVAALACVVAIGASLMSSAAIESRRLQTLESVSATTYVVRPGDSVWRIAEENPVDGLTTSEVVSYIEGANDLKSVCLNPGQVIDIPV